MAVRELATKQCSADGVYISMDIQNFIHAPMECRFWVERVAKGFAKMPRMDAPDATEDLTPYS